MPFTFVTKWDTINNKDTHPLTTPQYFSIFAR